MQRKFNNSIDHVFKFIYKSRIKTNQLLFTLLIKINLKIRGINLGAGCKFYGNTIFIKYPGSSISIGGNGRFRSNFRSNPVGLVRKNIFSTLNKDASIAVGNSCGFSGAAISSAKEIIIGNNVLIGANVIITDTNWHPIGNDIENKTGSIHIEDNVWIGANSIILKGVNIGKNSIIGAGSIVVKDIPPKRVAAGNPCKVLKSI